MTDAATDDSWWHFQQRLEQTLSGLADGEVLILEVADSPRYVQFLSWGEVAIHGEVSYDPSADPGADADRIMELGWQAPPRDRKGRPLQGSENWQLDVPPTDARRLAEMTVGVLREVWAVAEPDAVAVTRLDG